MQWHNPFANRLTSPSHLPQESLPAMGLVLEPRMLFDGAVAATTADAAATAEPADSSNNAGDGTGDSADSSESGLTDITVAGEGSRREVVFIDTAVIDYQTLLDNVPEGMDVVLLDADSDGLSQMAEWARSHSGYDAIHVLGHGSEGQVNLGSLTLDSAMAESRADDLKLIGSALTETGDILLYGCDVAEDSGQSFVALLAQLTSADIAASSDMTGAASQGGDWDLESTTGTVESSELAEAMEHSGWEHLLVLPDGVQDVTETTLPGSFITGFTLASDVPVTGDPGIGIYPDSGPDSATFTIAADNINVASFDLTAVDFVKFSTAGDFTLTVTGTKLDDSTVSTSFTTSDPFLTYTTGDYTNFTGIKQFTILISKDSASHIDQNTFDSFTVANAVAPASYDATSTVTASATLTEPATFATTATSSGTAASLLDFTIADTGASDGTATTVTALSLDVSGTTTDAERNNMVFLLNGPDATNVVGSYDDTTDTLTFSGLTLSIADAGSETYTVSGYYNDDSGSNDLTEGHTLILSVNAADFTTAASSSTFAGSQASVTNGSGAAIDITATKLVYSQSPSTSITSGSAFGSQPILQAVDARGNLDTGFSGTVTLTEASAGTLGGTTSVAASSGIATFTGISYAASSDQQTFVLSAAASGLTSVSSSTITADVVATQLVFSIQPSPTSIQSGQGTAFSSVPVVQAVDGNGIVDSGYSTDIVLSVTDPGDGTVDGTVNSLTSTGDSDGSGTTVTLTPGSGSVTFTGLTLQYTNSGASNSLALRATSGGLTAVNSDTITSAINSPPVISNLDGDSVAWPGTGNSVLLDAATALATSDSELDALNGGNGDWSGASLSVQRSGTALAADSFAFDTSGALFTVSGGNLQSGGQTFATYTSTGGVLSISFTSGSTPATTALVQDVLQHISYRNDTPYGDATLRFTLNDGFSDATADVTVSSDTIYVDQLTDDSDGDTSDGFSLREAVARAAAQSGTQTLVFASALAGQTLNLGSDLNIAENITLDADAASGLTLSGSNLVIGTGVTLAVSNGDTLHISSTISGSGALEKSGAGQLRLSGSNSYAGSTTVSGGILTFYTDSNLGSGTVELAGGQLRVNDNTTIDNDLTLSASNGLLETSRTVTWSGDISGTGNLEIAGGGTQTLSGNNTWTGSTTVSQGRVSIASDSNLGSGGLTLASGTGLTVTASTTIDNSITLSSGSVYISNDADLTLSGVISGSGGLWKQGSGTLTLSGSNTYTGTTVLQTGGLSISSDSNLGGDTLTMYAGSLTITAATTIDNAIGLGGTATIDNSADVTLSGNIFGSGGLSKSGAGILTLSGNNTYLGSTTISASSLSIASDSNLGSGSLALASGTSLAITAATTIDNAIALSGPATVSNSADVTLSGVVSGSGDLTKAGAGSLTLSGSNTWSGGTSITAGSLSIASDSNLGSGSLALASSTSLAITAATTIDNAIALSGPATVSNSADVTLSGVISGTSDLTKTGSGILTLSGSNTLSGLLDIQNGSVSLAGTLSGGVRVSTGTTLLGTGNIGGLVTVNSGGKLAPGSSPGSLSLSGGLVMATGSILDVEINGTVAGSGYDQLLVTGTVDISQATLALTLGYTPTAGDSYTLISNDGADAIVGTLAGLAEGGQFIVSGNSFQLSYSGGDGNDLVLTAINAAPVVTSLSGDTASFTAGDSPVLLDTGSDALVTDADSSDFDGGTLTVAITSGHASAEDLLAIRHQGSGSGQIGVSGSDVSYAGVVFGSATGGSGADSLVISLNSNATPAAVQALLQNLTYGNSNNSVTISTSDRGITVTVSDGDGGTSPPALITVSVDNGNQPPATSGITDQQATAGSAFSFTLPGGTFSDPDSGDSLTLSAALSGGGPLPAWLTFDPASGSFSGTAGAAEAGSVIVVEVTATDTSSASVTASFSLTVAASNQPPVAGEIPDQQVIANTTFLYTVPATIFSDPDSGDSLTLSAASSGGGPLPAWLTFDPATGSFSGTPDAAEAGSVIVVEVTATDTSSASVTASFSLAVAAVPPTDSNQPPVAGEIPDQQITANTPFLYTLPADTFSDPDSGDSLSLAATLEGGTPLPAWLAFDPGSSTFTGLPATTEVGNSYRIVISATDNAGATATSTFSLIISQSTLDLGIPEFRSSQTSDNSFPPPADNSVAALEESPASAGGQTAPPALLPGFGQAQDSQSTTRTASIFRAADSLRNTATGFAANGRTPLFAPLSAELPASFADSLGYFPGFGTESRPDDRTTLSSIFSGIHLPSVTPMQIYQGGSWSSLDVNTGSLAADHREPHQPAPSLEQQLSQLETGRITRIDAMEQALANMSIPPKPVPEV